MKLLICHDDAGRIVSAAAPSPEHRGRIGLKPSPGLHVAEIDTPDIDHPGQLVHLRTRFRIERATPGTARLVRQ